MLLIEREAAKAKKVYCEERHEYVVPVSELDWLTTIDAAPVVHGKWKRTPVSGILFCGVCDQLQRDRKETPYCPLCGARLDGGEGHEAD